MLDAIQHINFFFQADSTQVRCACNTDLIRFYSAPLCKRCTSYGNSVCLSVCLSVTRRYCVKTTTARSTVQFAMSDSKICLAL